MGWTRRQQTRSRPNVIVAISLAASLYAAWALVADGAWITATSIIILCNRIDWAIGRIDATSPVPGA